MLLSHLSPKPSLSPLSSFLSSLALRRPPKSPFRPSHFPKSTRRPRPRPSVPPSLACHVSAGNGVRGFVSMDSDLAVSVDSVAHDLKNQSLGGDDTKTLGLRLEDLNWDHSFVRALPGDPRTDTIPREVEEKKRFFIFFSSSRYACLVLEKIREMKILKLLCYAFKAVGLFFVNV
jgi:hypothetical protein